MSQNTKVDERITIKTQLLAGIANGTIAQNYTLSMLSLMSGSATTGPASGVLPFGSQPEYIERQFLYDEVKVTGFTVKFRPSVTQQNLYDQGYVESANLQKITDPIIHTCIDRDGNTITNSSTQVPTKMQCYDSYKSFSCYKPWSRKVAVKGIWMDTKLLVTQLTSNYATVLQTQAGYLSTLIVYGENLPWNAIPTATTEVYGVVEVHYHMCFRGKRPVSLALDRDGNLVMTPASAFAPIATTYAALPLTYDTSGTLVSFDASGIPIPVAP